MSSKRLKPDGPELNSDADEIAFALLLWKFLRGHYVGYASGGVQMVIDESPYKAMELARKCGVSEEFFKLLMKFPVTKITIKEYEPWSSNDIERQLKRTPEIEVKPCPLASENGNGSKKRKRGPRSRPRSGT